MICIMGLYYYKCWVDWHFKNKNFDAKFKQTATIQVAPEKKKRSSSFTTNDPTEAWDYSKKKLFATGGIANHFRKK